MSFRRTARFGPMHRALSWGVGITVALGLAATVVAIDSSEHPAEHTLAAAEPNANDKLDSISAEADPHAHHRHMLETSTYSRSLHSYDLPDLALVNMQGQKTSLLNEVSGDRPVMLNFIFTTCTTICPVLSATFSQVEKELGAERDRVRMVSITIDPEYDTPVRLRAYAARYNAGDQWQFLTGSREDIVAVQKAFDAYRGTKMNHEPFIFLRVSAQEPWVRLDGLASAADVVREYRQLLTGQNAGP